MTNDWDIAELDDGLDGIMIQLDGAMDGTKLIIAGKRKIDSVFVVADMDSDIGANADAYCRAGVDKKELAAVFMHTARELFQEGLEEDNEE